MSLFLPAIKLMNRLSYTKKFAVLGLISAIAATVGIFNLYVSLGQVIHSTQRELDGIVLIKTISRSVQLLQQHRALSAGEIGGIESMRDERIAKENLATESLDKLYSQLHAELKTSRDLHIVKSDWMQLRENGLNWGQERNFNAHSELIRRMFNIEVAIADSYALTNDPDIGLYYLISTIVNRLPTMTELMGRIRGYGVGILSVKHADQHQKIILGTMLASIEREIAPLSANLDKTGRYNKMMQASLQLTSRDIAMSLQKIINLAQTDILLDRYATQPADFYAMTTIAIDRVYDQIYVSLLPATETLLETRLGQARTILYLSIGIALLLFIIVVYFAIGGYFAIMGNIQSLAKSAHLFASGSVDQRIHLNSNDELAQVGASFNEMAEGFATLLTARQQYQERLRSIIDTALDAVVQMNNQGFITGWNRQAEVIFGWQKQEVMGRSMHEVIIPMQYRNAHIRGLQHFLATGEGPVLNKRIEIVALHRFGHEFPIELAISPNVLDSNYEFSAFIRDISEKKQSEALIWNQANFDALTQLPNRRMFGDRLTQEIKKSYRSHQPLALLFIDLDHFKDVNDNLGHSAGDQLLQEAARRISTCVRESDTVARLGGDEFTVILTEIEDVTVVERIVENILQRLAEPFQLDEEITYPSASIGITFYPDNASDVEGLLKSADQAMYVAKHGGRNRFSYFSSALQEAAKNRLQLIHDLRSALENNQLVVNFQPIVDIATGQIVKAEALLRWQHPIRGIIDPMEFIPLAEETGLIHAIGDWVFRQSMQHLKHWRAVYYPEFQISVNKSPLQFQAETDQERPHWLENLRSLGLPGKSVVVEITEGLLLNVSGNATSNLRKLRDAGVQVAIDDFGTGYSALSYLTKFDIDYLKIDQSFVASLSYGAKDIALPEAIIVMAHRLGMKVVAEGVETVEQRDVLNAIGCDYAQGFLFSKALPVDQFEILLKQAFLKPELTKPS